MNKTKQTTNMAKSLEMFETLFEAYPCEISLHILFCIPLFI